MIFCEEGESPRLTNDKAQQTHKPHNQPHTTQSNNTSSNEQQSFSTQVSDDRFNRDSPPHHARAQDQGRVAPALGRSWRSSSIILDSGTDESTLVRGRGRTRTEDQVRPSGKASTAPHGQSQEGRTPIVPRGDGHEGELKHDHQSADLQRRGTDPQSVRAGEQRTGGVRKAWGHDLCPGDGTTSLIHPVGTSFWEGGSNSFSRVERCRPGDRSRCTVSHAEGKEVKTSALVDLHRMWAFLSSSTAKPKNP